MRVFSFGGGVQSHGLMVLQAEGRLPQPYEAFVFANVGEDSENPDTLAYIERVTKPFCEAHGIPFVETRRKTHGEETLYAKVMRTLDHNLIPLRIAGGRPGHRTCSYQFKIKVIHDWLGAGDHVTGIGFSWEEAVQRIHDSDDKRFVNEYPLVELRMTKANCYQVIAEAGIPRPPKSSCYFCPFHSIGQWIELRERRPDLFEKAMEIEESINRKRLGRRRVWLTRRAQPLHDAIARQPRLIPDEENTCESGYCMT